MGKVWSDRAWDDYLWWQAQDRAGLRRLNSLIRDIERAGATGRPPARAEVLKESRNGLRSVRIDRRNRLVYRFEEDGRLAIIGCRGHYE